MILIAMIFIVMFLIVPLACRDEGLLVTFAYTIGILVVFHGMPLACMMILSPDLGSEVVSLWFIVNSVLMLVISPPQLSAFTSFLVGISDGNVMTREIIKRDPRIRKSWSDLKASIPRITIWFIVAGFIALSIIPEPQ